MSAIGLSAASEPRAAQAATGIGPALRQLGL